MYNVFVRDWWRIKNGTKVPYENAPKTYLERDVTWADARRICDEYNATHKPGVSSRKAEFEEA